MSCCCFPGAPASGSDRRRSRLHGVLGLLRACCYSFGGFLFVFFWVFGFFFFPSSYNLSAGLGAVRRRDCTSVLPPSSSSQQKAKGRAGGGWGGGELLGWKCE